uniref:AAA+ ATPase domain-containing protein n=1 Tax=viral metagenome TaxID=1070528 RepID=A0A6C0BSG2_9ZZZZ
MNNSIPWVEKYRPNNFENIVLDLNNEVIFNNIVDMNIFPNLLFYGPPGTGKTTTIINLIKKYQERYNQVHKSLVIHLNASDERGIEIIRSQIMQFINSKPLFSNGLKFVILDEVDYMTKNAQQALKYLLQSYNENVKFCLICNYISKIDESLKKEFIRLKFNQLPCDKIYNFIENIVKNEDLNISKNDIILIQKLFKSDIRSMINFLQSNQEFKRNEKIKIKIINDTIWDTLTDKIKKNNKKIISNVSSYINEVSIEYNIDQKHMIKNYINYMIDNNINNIISEKFLNFVENILHVSNVKNGVYITYFICQMKNFLMNEDKTI